MSETIIKAENLTKIYRRGSEDVRALNGISLEIAKGDFTAFVGPSGSGKTTLVNILGCLDNPSSGNLSVGGSPVFSGDRVLSETELTYIRRQYFGYIFQSFYLIPTLTVIENTLLPFTFYKGGGTAERAVKMLDMLGLQRRLDHLPKELSGGEMQRVALARALVNDPKILLADEPTGNLDAKRSMEVGTLLQELNSTSGLTIIMVTHNPELARLAKKIITLKDGVIEQGQ